MFVPHAEFLSAAERPRAWILFLHGIYGRGGNWRRIARAVCEARPAWGAGLVDLRMHGKSRGAPPPHTLAAAAEDVAQLAGEMARGGREVRAVCGHSFGGKVAAEIRGRQLIELAHTFVLDSSPSPHPEALEDPRNAVARVLQMLEELPGPFPDRSAFVSRVTERGFPRALGQWLAMNLERREDSELELALDPAAMRALLSDYHRRDLWEALAAEGGPGTVDVVVAGRSSVLSGEERRRLAELAEASRDRLRVHELPEADHWLNVDAPEEVIEILVAALEE